MMNFKKLVRFAPVLLALPLSACAKDPNTPATLAQQQEAAKGFAPTKEQLDAAMSKFKTPGDGGASMAPPAGASPTKG